jgi:hypothetical protein
MRRFAIVGSLALLLGYSFAGEADCPFITDGEIRDISGDASGWSEGRELVFGTGCAFSGAEALEARYRTWDESAALSIRTDRYYALRIIVR